VEEGYFLMGSQQQYCLRNCHTNRKLMVGACSFVFIGCTGESDGRSMDDVNVVTDIPAAARGDEAKNQGHDNNKQQSFPCPNRILPTISLIGLKRWGKLIHISILMNQLHLV
jgi:hypothetical protein